MEILKSLITDPISRQALVGYFIIAAMLIYILKLFNTKSSVFIDRMAGSDGVLEPIEMLVLEYLLIMPIILLGNVFVSLEVDPEVYKFLDDMLLFLIGGNTIKFGIKEHYKSKNEPFN
jgi:hypothetical protein